MQYVKEWQANLNNSEHETHACDARTAALAGRRLYVTIALGIALWVAIYTHLHDLARWLTYGVFGLPEASRLAQSVEFFIFEAPKVLMLLVLVIFAVGVVRSFFAPERTRAMLAGKRESVGNVFAACLGIVTPFCSCSAVPLFIGFVEAGIPLGVTFSFLIAAPMINEVAIVLLFGMFGAKVALIYIATGLAISILAGWTIGRLKLERYVEDWVYGIKMDDQTYTIQYSTWADRLGYGLITVREIVGKVWPYVLAGIAVGAGIHGYVPEGVLASVMGKSTWWSVPVAVIIGVPMYSNAAGVIPVVHALVEKGAALGTVLAFMMAVIGLSLPELIILRKVLKRQLIAVFVAVVTTGILAVGYLFNAIL